MKVDKRNPGSMIPVVMADPAPGPLMAIAAVVLVVVSVLATVAVTRTPPKDESTFCEAALKDFTVGDLKTTHWFIFSPGEDSATTTVDMITKELVQKYSVTCELRTPLTFKKG